MKREGISTLFIRSYLRALNFLITLKMLCVLCKFENILKTPSFRKLCNDSRIVENVYKVLVLKIFFEKGVFGKMFVFERVRCENGFSL